MPATPPGMPPGVRAAFDAYPEAPRRALLQVRDLIFAVADGDADVNGVTETLKWREPAYLSATGSTIRLGWSPKRPEQAAVYFICRTSLVDAFRARFGDDLAFEGDRAILLDPSAPPPEHALAGCIQAALTYKLRKRA